MSSRNALTYVLAIQLVLALFCPPIPFAGRLLFGADLWAFLWIPFFAIYGLYLVKAHQRRRDLITYLGVLLVIAIIFIHGKNRPSLAIEMNRFIAVPTDDLFSFGREAVIAGRFFLWCIGALAVSKFPMDRALVVQVLGICLAVAVVATLGTHFSPDLRETLGRLYHYNPNVENWADRSFGIFQSPIEACATYSLGLLLILQSETIGFRGKIGLAFVILLGIFFTKTLTAFVALTFALLFCLIQTLPDTRRRKVYFLSALAGTSAVAAVWNSEYFIAKRTNLIFRMKPWSVYWDSSMTKLDRFFLGHGFIPHFADNIWVYFFSRGGVFLIGVVLYLLFTGYKKYGKTLTPFQLSIPVFFLIAGMSVDILIMRPIVYVLVSVAVPALLERSRQ